MTGNIDFWLPCQSKDGMRCHYCLCQSACLSVCHIPIQLCSKQLALFRPRYFSLIFDKTFDALKEASNNKLSPQSVRRYVHRRWQFDPKIVADLRLSADGSAVRTSLVAGGG